MALGITDAVELVRTISDLVQKGTTIGLQENIMELREAVLNAKDEALTQRERVRDLESQLALRHAMEFDGTLYWKQGLEGAARGPFCPKCYDDEKKVVHLQRGGQGEWPWRCMVCSKPFNPSR